MFSIEVLTQQLETLQLVVNDAAGALNAQGNMLEICLQDIPVRAREVALHGVQMRSGHDLRLLQPGYPDNEDPDDY